MSQDAAGDPVVPPGTIGTTAFFALSDAIAAVRSFHSGATEPAVTIPYMIWADTSSASLKQRNAADSGWITLWRLGAGTSAGVFQKAASFTVDQPGTYFVSDAAGAVVVTLPAIADAFGWNVRVKKTNSGGNTITLTPDGSETIEGASSVVLTSQYDDSEIIPSTVEWLAF